MTTIIATTDALYSDSLSGGGDLAFKTDKLYRIGKRNSKIVGCAGNSEVIHMYLDALRKRHKFAVPKHVAEDDRRLSVLIVSKEGIFHAEENGVLEPVREPFVAIGSGGKIAMGVLTKISRSGKILTHEDFKEAIEIASIFDENTRLPMQTMYLDPKRTNADQIVQPPS